MAVHKALEQGDPLPGNMMVAQDPRLWYELRDLFAAHGVHEEFTWLWQRFWPAPFKLLMPRPIRSRT